MRREYKAMELTLKMVETRDTIKVIRPNFEKEMKEIGELIKNLAEKRKVSPLDAGLLLIKERDLPVICQMLVIAAVVELIEKA